MSVWCILLTCSSDLLADLFFCGIHTVYDRSIDSAHKCHSSVQLFLELRNIILRKCSLPDVNPKINHILYDRFHEGICVMHDDHSMVFHIFIGSFILWFDKFSPCVRTDEQGLLGTPVIVGKDDIRVEIINDQLCKLEPVLTNGIAEIHHILRLKKEVHQHILKSHQEVKPLKNTCRHKCHEKAS